MSIKQIPRAPERRRERKRERERERQRAKKEKEIGKRVLLGWEGAWSKGMQKNEKRRRRGEPSSPRAYSGTKSG